MPEALCHNVRRHEPTAFSATVSIEEDVGYPSQWVFEGEAPLATQWSAHWEQSRANYHVIYISYSSGALSIFSDECFPDSLSNLSVFAHLGEPDWAQLYEDVANFWNVPALSTRSGDESARTTEGQLDRLQRCSGAEIAEAVRIELEQQIEAADEGDATIPIAALIRLVDFVCAHPRVKPPILFASQHTIKAQWQPSSERIAWIEFDGTEQVRLLAFCPDPKAAGGIKRYVAHSTVQSAYIDLLHFGVDWVAR